VSYLWDPARCLPCCLSEPPESPMFQVLAVSSSYQPGSRQTYLVNEPGKTRPVLLGTCQSQYVCRTKQHTASCLNSTSPNFLTYLLSQLTDYRLGNGFQQPIMLTSSCHYFSFGFCLIGKFLQSYCKLLQASNKGKFYQLWFQRPKNIFLNIKNLLIQMCQAIKQVFIGKTLPKYHRIHYMNSKVLL